MSVGWTQPSVAAARREAIAQNHADACRHSQLKPSAIRQAERGGRRLRSRRATRISLSVKRRQQRRATIWLRVWPPDAPIGWPRSASLSTDPGSLVKEPFESVPFQQSGEADVERPD